MIVGWWFMVSNQVLNTDSNYKFMKSVVEGILGATDHEKDSFVVFLPHNSRITYRNDGFFDRHADHVLARPLSQPSRKNLQSKHFDADRVFRETDTHGIGAYWNNIPEIGAQLSYLLASYRATGDRTPGPYTLTYNHYTIHDSLPYPVEGYDDLRLLELLGNYLSDVSVFNSRHNNSMLRDNADDFGVTHWLDERERKGQTAFIPIPVLDDELGEFYDPEADFAYAPSEDDVVFYYNHRLQDYKHWRKTFDLLDSFWSAGSKNFRVWLSYASGDRHKSVRESYPFIKLKQTHAHRDYYRELQHPHFNTINTTHETFCISMVESALLGGIPIVPERVTFPEIFPDDYPLMFSDGDEQHEMVSNAIEGGYTQEWLTDLKHDLRDHFSQYSAEEVGKLAYEELHSRYLEYAREQYTMLKDPGVCDDFFANAAGWRGPFKDFDRAFRKATGLGPQAMPTWRLSALMELYPHRTYVDDSTIYVEIQDGPGPTDEGGVGV